MADIRYKQQQTYAWINRPFVVPCGVRNGLNQAKTTLCAACARCFIDTQHTH